jgi:hypothetical protein
MAVNLSPVYGVAGQLFNNNGDPLAGGKIYTYLAGTTTNAATYINSAGNIAHSNPIVLDGAGRVPSGEIWLTDGITYKFVVEDSASNLIGTYDNLTGINSNFVSYTSQQEIQTATAGQTVFTLTTMQYQPGTNNLSVFVDGVNQYGPGAQYAYVETSDTVVTFTNGLHVGAEVKFTTAQLNSSGATNAALVVYDPPFVNGVPTTVETKLSEMVSVKDFGAIGDGIIDDTTAIINAIAAASIVLFPSGTYLVTTELSFPRDVKLVFQANAKIDHGNNQIYFNGPINSVTSDIVDGAGAVSYASATNVVCGNIMIRPQDKANINNLENFYRNTPFTILQDRSIITSATSITPGLGSKTFTLDVWQNEFTVIGLQVYIYNNTGNPVIDGATARMGGSLIAYNVNAKTATINITTNSLPATPNANWKLIIDRPLAIFIDEGNIDNKSTSSGIIGWVGASKANPTPFSYTLALYAGNTAIPCIYGQTNGKWGFGTESPSTTVHAVGQNVDSTLLPGGFRADYLLTNPRPMFFGHANIPSLGGEGGFLYASVDASEANTLKYPSNTAPMQRTQRVLKEFDIYKLITGTGNTYVNILTIALPSSGANQGAFTVICEAGGFFSGQYGGGVGSQYDVYSNATWTPVVSQRGSTTNYGWGAAFGANAPDIRVVQTGGIVAVQIKSGLDPVNPIDWYAYCSIRIEGFLGFSGVSINIV